MHATSEALPAVAVSAHMVYQPSPFWQPVNLLAVVAACCDVATDVHEYVTCVCKSAAFTDEEIVHQVLVCVQTKHQQVRLKREPAGPHDPGRGLTAGAAEDAAELGLAAVQS